MEPGDALRLGLHHEGALAQRILGRDAGRAAIGVAALRLHAAERKHETARGIAPVRSQGEHARHVEAGDDAPTRADAYRLAQPGADQRVVGQEQTLAQRRSDVVGEFEWRGAGAALLAVDHDKIGTDAGFQHRLADRHEFPRVADAQLEANRLAAAKFAQLGDEMHHLDGGCERRMSRRRHAVDAARYAARRGDLGRHLGRGQHAAVAWLGPLRQLDLDHFDLLLPRHLLEVLRAERAVRIAAAEIAAADLPDDVAAEFAVILAKAPLPGVMREPADLGALIERANRGRAECAKAHRRDVQQRQRIRFLAARSAHDDPEIVTVGRTRRERVIDPLVIAGIDVLLGAEWALVELALGALIRDRALGAVEGRTVVFALEKILADFRTDLLEQEAKIGKNGVVALETMGALNHVPDAERNEPDADQEQDKQSPGQQECFSERSGQAKHDCACNGRNEACISHGFLPVGTLRFAVQKSATQSHQHNAGALWLATDIYSRPSLNLM